MRLVFPQRLTSQPCRHVCMQELQRRLHILDGEAFFSDIVEWIGRVLQTEHVALIVIGYLDHVSTLQHLFCIVSIQLVCESDGRCFTHQVVFGNLLLRQRRYRLLFEQLRRLDTNAILVGIQRAEKVHEV